MSKKYYWLKLKEDFFRQKEIKKLRKIAGGDTYTIIYLKLQLLSLKENGKLIFEGIEDTLAEELALEIDEDEENVKVTLLYLLKHGLVEEVNSEVFQLPQTMESIGYETEWAAKKREYRKKLSTNTEDNVLIESEPSLSMSDKREEREIDIEIEKDIDIERREREDKDNSQSRLLNNTDVFKHFEKCGFRLTPLQYEEIATDVEIFSRQWLMDAAGVASNRGKLSYSYVKGILNNWLSEGRKEGDTDGSSKSNTQTSEKYKGYDFSFDRKSSKGNETFTGDDIETEY